MRDAGVFRCRGIGHHQVACSDPVGFWNRELGCSLSTSCVWALALLGALGSLDPPRLNGFDKWVFVALGLLNEFVRQVVISPRDAGFAWLG